MLILLLLVAAALCFGIAAWMTRSVLALGLLFWVLTELLPKLL